MLVILLEIAAQPEPFLLLYRRAQGLNTEFLKQSKEVMGRLMSGGLGEAVACLFVDCSWWVLLKKDATPLLPDLDTLVHSVLFCSQAAGRILMSIPLG